MSWTISFSLRNAGQLESEAGWDNLQLTHFGVDGQGECEGEPQLTHTSTGALQYFCGWPNLWHLKHLRGDGVNRRMSYDENPRRIFVGGNGVEKVKSKRGLGESTDLLRFGKRYMWETGKPCLWAYPNI
jgi:hypothetical protein